MEAGYDVLECGLPAVITVTAGANEPRYPSLGIMQAKQKPLERLSLTDLGLSEAAVAATQMVVEVTEAPAVAGGEIDCGERRRHRPDRRSPRRGQGDLIVTTIWVFAPVTSEGAHPAAFELLTKARSLGDQVAAVALGPGAEAAAADLGAHGAASVYVSDDPVFAEHPGRPAAHVLTDLVAQHHPSLILFPATYDARDVAGRLQAHTGSTLMSNATDVLGSDRVRTEIFGGAVVVDVELAGPEPRLVLVRPRSLPRPSRPVAPPRWSAST